MFYNKLQTKYIAYCFRKPIYDSCCHKPNDKANKYLSQIFFPPINNQRHIHNVLDHNCSRTV